MMCDIVGTVQQLEFDVLAIDIVPDDPLILEAKISNMQVYSQLSALCSSINFATFFLIIHKCVCIHSSLVDDLGLAY